VIAQQFVVETGASILSFPGQFMEDLNPRATQFIAIDLLNGRGPGGQQKLLYIFNTHFAYAISDAVGNSKKTLEYMSKKTDYNNDLVILAGDLNCEPGSPPIDLIDATLLKDLWVYMWGDTQEGLTYPSPAPTKRIDYIFASPPLAKHCTSTEQRMLQITLASWLPLISKLRINLLAKLEIWKNPFFSSR